MRKVWIILPLILLLLNSTIKAQETGLTDNGFYELQIGKGFDAVKNILESTPVRSHYDLLMEKYYVEQGWGWEESGEPLNTYLVKSTEKKYFKIGNVPVKSIEVKISHDKKIIGIMIMIEKQDKNVSAVKTILQRDFGLRSCAETVDDPSQFYCGLGEEEDEEGGVNFKVYTFDGVGELTVNDLLYIRYCIDTDEQSGCY